MESRFLYFSKVTLRVLCLFTVTILLKYIVHLGNKSVNYVRFEYFNDKYLLLWTDPSTVPFVYLGTGKTIFVTRKCSYTNCVVTADRTLLKDVGMFDVIAFHGPDILNMYNESFPKRRLSHQKYVFASIEAADNYPLCTDKYNNYFNWTWTYKLDSEVRWGYFVIRNSKGFIIGPNQYMNWLEWSEMKEVNNKTRQILQNKSKAIAWFVSNCVTRSRREGFVVSLQSYLAQYNVQIDIYGSCGGGGLSCPRENEEDCNKMIKTDYYFYLAFENAFSEDYVTEKVLIPLQNYAIPIVYGGADYSRFLPPGSYLDARELGVYDLGDKIYQLLHNPELYEEYFKWTNHYSYHKMSERPETDEYCQMCALMNDEWKIRQKSVYKNLQVWWDSTIDCFIE